MARSRGNRWQAEWMGHKSIQTTLRYAHLAPKDLDVAAKALVAVA